MSHAAPHFDSVPSLSRDSDVGDLPVDLVASSRDPSVFRASQVVLLCSGHAYCYAIRGAAECDLSACAVQMQGLAPESPGSTSLVSRWTPS